MIMNHVASLEMNYEWCERRQGHLELQTPLPLEYEDETPKALWGRYFENNIALRVSTNKCSLANLSCTLPNT